MMKEDVVIVVGAGPSGIATSACLNRLSIPNIVLEREDCLASLWMKKSYDSLHLSLAKQFSELPHLSIPADYPKYASREQFIRYLDNYASHFKVCPLYNRLVELATFNEATRKWCVKVRNTTPGGSDGDCEEEYRGRFLVVAAGETSHAYIPEVEGLDSFRGEVLHSTEYKTGEKYTNKNVLVVGAGNSGMEIALDLVNFGAKTSIVVRSPLHIISRGMADIGLILVKYIPLSIVDGLLVILSKLVYGDTTKYGITRPKKGPFFMQWKYGKYPVIDVGTFNKIKSGQIQVLPSTTHVTGEYVGFANGKSYRFDLIVFATGFKRSTSKWLKDDKDLLDENGISKQNFPNNWKGQNGLYCTGLSRRGPYGAAVDAQKIATDIKRLW
ncbi:Pyridine nucleotide-disulfide oxidoreductase [Macleaya cordata]|uniref:Flavin-containing monooxygenase n=1 Tax=Macleaya cordata TaxID=56857 RepID=A0A200Q651_MACCD|nr:Pyridine nucleotide-disulfide oxidoreductase [Macleaya cordata]